MTRRRLTPLLLGIVAAHLAAGAWYARQRPIDGDEGYYALAARLVREGGTPYTDFFYPQAPLVPYLYAPVVAAAGPSLLALRGLSVALGALTVLAWALWLRRARADAPLAAAVALLVLAASPGWLDWNLTVKTFAAANLGAAAGLVSLGLAHSSPRRGRWLAGGGAALGLATGARLLYAPLAIAPALVLAFDRDGRPARRRATEAGQWLAGVAAGAAPLWAWLARDPGLFWFNNLTYHRLRFSPTADDSATVRLAATLTTLGRTLLADPFLVLSLALAAWGALSWRRAPAAGNARTVERAAALGAVLLLGAHLLPDPIQGQYFTGTLAPLLVPLVAGGLVRVPASRARPVALAAAAALAACAALSARPPRSEVQASPVWSWDHYRRTCAQVERLTRPDATVLAFWPGYVFETGRRPCPGFENQFAAGVAGRLTRDERRRYRVAGLEETVAIVREGRADLLVLGAWMHDVDHTLTNAQAARLNEALAERFEVVVMDGPIKLCLPRGVSEPGI